MPTNSNSLLKIQPIEVEQLLVDPEKSSARVDYNRQSVLHSERDLTQEPVIPYKGEINGRIRFNDQHEGRSRKDRTRDSDRLVCREVTR